MDCRAARDWLLQAEHPEQLDAGPDGLAAHVAACSTCRHLAVQLTRLEADYRSLPLPASVEQARGAFLARLPIPFSAPAVSRRPRWRRFVRPRWALTAAILLFLLGSAVWVLLPTPPTQECPDLVEQLIDWNLDLASSPTVAERKHLQEQASRLRSAVKETDLGESERDLAETLLETGQFISTEVDPMEQADRFNDLADKVVALIDENKKDAKRLRKLASYYRLIAEEGIHANLERAEKSRLTGDRQKKRDRMLKREAARLARLTALLERVPSASRKDIRRALEPRKPHKPKKRRKR